MKETVILIGNGINRLGKQAGPSWGSLLNSLQNEVGCNVDLQNDFKPFPMAFEEMLMTNCTHYVDRLKLFKKAISKTFLETSPNEFHKKIIDSQKVKHILTTNYDYAFEKVIVHDFSNREVSETAFKTKEIKYSLRRRNVLSYNSGELNVWHIHGELYDPKNYQNEKKHFKEESILIGYEHYSEALKVMQDYKNGKNKWAKTPLKRKLLESQDLQTSWIDFFFTSKLIIVGLDLSFSEIDLWWLLNFRARWLKEFGTKRNVPSSIKGEVRLLYPVFNSKAAGDVAKQYKVKKESVNRDVEKNKARGEVLKAFDVQVEEVGSKNYEHFYDQFISRHL
ncbi:MAG: SIR2 family protein [Flavisolibacter sp.]